jgi:hypothetical protein
MISREILDISETYYIYNMYMHEITKTLSCGTELGFLFIDSLFVSVSLSQ